MGTVAPSQALSRWSGGCSPKTFVRLSDASSPLISLTIVLYRDSLRATYPNSLCLKEFCQRFLMTFVRIAVVAMRRLHAIRHRRGPLQGISS